MSQDSSLTQSGHSVRQALTAYTRNQLTGRVDAITPEASDFVSLIGVLSENFVHQKSM